MPTLPPSGLPITAARPGPSSAARVVQAGPEVPRHGERATDTKCVLLFCTRSPPVGFGLVSALFPTRNAEISARWYIREPSPPRVDFTFIFFAHALFSFYFLSFSHVPLFLKQKIYIPHFPPFLSFFLSLLSYYTRFIINMGVETTAHHGEDISPAPRATSPEQKPYNVGVDTPIPRINMRTFVMGAFVSIGGLLFGYDTGQISGFQEMDDYKQRYGELQPDGSYSFGNVRAGLIVSLLSIGTLIGALCGAPLADKLGRKWSITLWCIILNIGLVVQISTPAGRWYQMVVGRWVTGLGVGGCSLVVPMYQGESAPRHIRGSIICCYQLFVTLGIFLSYCINLGTESMNNTGQWRITLGLTFLFAVALGGGMLFFPESPRYDYRQGNVEACRTNLAKFYGIPENHTRILEEMNEIREQYEIEVNQEQKWHEFLTAPRMFFRIVLGMVLQSLQQLTGANYFFYYVCPYYISLCLGGSTCLHVSTY